VTEPPPLTPLTDQTLARLRKLMDGNGLALDKIELVETQEKIYDLEGITQLVPFCERHEGHYPGPPRGDDRTLVSDSATLQSEAQRRHQEFLAGRDWLPGAMNELKEAPAQGWGLDGAKITLREKSVILAAVETCPACQGRSMLTCEQCQGQGTVTCPQCHGSGQELCYNCAGSGQNPAHPGQPCVICNGRKYAACRFCRASGKLNCPTCQGRAGVVCPQCRGTGGATEEVILVCGVTINFRLSGEGLPSGLRRGLDRIGIANLAQGHADIQMLSEKRPEDTVPGASGTKPPEPSLIVHYAAKLPYADMKLRFRGGRAVLVSAFGKRGLLMGVPPYLDDALQPWREHLKRAAAGTEPLDGALKARAMRDALALELNGEGKPENLRRLYPAGLLPKTMQEIFTDMRRALNRMTLQARAGAAAGIGVAATGLLAAIFLSPLHAYLTNGWRWSAGLAFDFVLLAAIMSLGWVGLGVAVKLLLKRRFSGLKISLHHNAGHVGYGLLASIFIAWFAILFAAPVKPLWLLYLTGG